MKIDYSIQVANYKTLYNCCENIKKYKSAFQHFKVKNNGNRTVHPYIHFVNICLLKIH